MVNADEAARLQAELQKAEQALAAFDVGSLLTDDGTMDEEATAKMERLKAGVDAARAQLAAARSR